MIAVDINVLVYATDAGAGDKYRIAKMLLSATMSAGTLLLPLQVLGEFAHLAVRKAGHVPAFLEQFVPGWSAVGQVEGYRLEDGHTAPRARVEHNLPFRDALIWAVYGRSGVDALATEDFQDGRQLGGVWFLDPFNPMNADRLGLPRA